MVTRAVDKNYLQMTSPELLVQIQNNFTELFLIMSSSKIAQMVSLYPTKWLQEIQKYRYRAVDKKYLITTSSPEGLVQIQNNFSKCPPPKMQKWFCSTEQNG